MFCSRNLSLALGIRCGFCKEPDMIRGRAAAAADDVGKPAAMNITDKNTFSGDSSYSPELVRKAGIRKHLP